MSHQTKLSFPGVNSGKETAIDNYDHSRSDRKKIILNAKFSNIFSFLKASSIATFKINVF